MVRVVPAPYRTSRALALTAALYPDRERPPRRVRRGAQFLTTSSKGWYACRLSGSPTPYRTRAATVLLHEGSSPHEGVGRSADVASPGSPVQASSLWTAMFFEAEKAPSGRGCVAREPPTSGSALPVGQSEKEGVPMFIHWQVRRSWFLVLGVIAILFNGSRVPPRRRSNWASMTSRSIYRTVVLRTSCQKSTRSTTCRWSAARP